MRTRAIIVRVAVTRRPRRKKESRRGKRQWTYTRSILCVKSEEVMDGTSVMVQPSISPYLYYLLFPPLHTDTPPRALSFFPCCASARPKGRQWRSNAPGIRQLCANFISWNDDAGEIRRDLLVTTKRFQKIEFSKFQRCCTQTFVVEYRLVNHTVACVERREIFIFLFRHQKFFRAE